MITRGYNEFRFAFQFISVETLMGDCMHAGDHGHVTIEVFTHLRM